MQLPGVGYGPDQHRDCGAAAPTGPRYRAVPVAAAPFWLNASSPCTKFCKKSRGEAKSSAGIFHSRDRPENQTGRSRAPLIALTTARRKI